MVIRHPTIEDGPAIWKLVVEAGTLDRNSCYGYLLLCRDFAESCAVAENNGEIQGFVSGFRRPQAPETWFLWQIGVAESARGQGLAGRMAYFVLNALTPRIRFLETTVTPSNEASRALFNGIARRLDTNLNEESLFTPDLFPDSGHEPEPLLRIGPFTEKAVLKAKQ